MLAYMDDTYNKLHKGCCFLRKWSIGHTMRIKCFHSAFNISFRLSSKKEKKRTTNNDWNYCWLFYLWFLWRIHVILYNFLLYFHINQLKENAKSTSEIEHFYLYILLQINVLHGLNDYGKNKKICYFVRCNFQDD